MLPAKNLINMHYVSSNCISFFQQQKKEFVLSKQILRCGTSIGANIREAIQAESKADFIHKMSIALKETCETEYWLNLMKDSELIDMATFESYENDCVELIKLTTAITKTSKRNKK